MASDITAVPIDPDDCPVTQMMKRYGAPEMVVPAKRFKRMSRPIIYFWTRNGRPLYIGVSTAGVGRPFAANHHVLHRMQAGDRLYIWTVPTGFHAEMLESELIRQFLPEFNRAGKPGPRQPSDYLFLKTGRAEVERKIERLKSSLQEAKNELRKYREFLDDPILDETA